MYHQMFEGHTVWLKALAQPRRLEIIHLLRNQELSVAQIYQMLDLPQANISQHLSVLRLAGILKDRRQGKKIYYRLAHDNIIKASDLIRQALIDTGNTDLDLATAHLPAELDQLVPLTHDPVCHMRLAPKLADFSWVYQKKRYYFCASGCLKKFKENPVKYC